MYRIEHPVARAAQGDGLDAGSVGCSHGRDRPGGQAVVGLRPTPETEDVGLDIVEHGEAGYEG